MSDQRSSITSGLVAAAVIAAGIGSQAVPVQAAPTLLGHWTFDEGSGTQSLDSSGQGRDASIIGSPAWVSGIAGTALSFDGSGTNYLVVPGTQGDHLQQGFTVSAWISSTSTVESTVVNKTLGGVQTGWFINVREGTGLGDFYVNGEDGRITGAYVTDGGWHHLVGTYDGDSGDEILYVDGTPVAWGTVAYSSINSQPWMIGGAQMDASYGGGFTTFSGDIDDVQIYDSALSASAVAFLYANPGITAPEPATLSLLALGGLAMLRRRARDR